MQGIQRMVPWIGDISHGCPGIAVAQSSDLACSGGDGAIDIYVFPMAGTLEGQTIAYPGHCASTPAYIMLNDALTSRYFMPGGFEDFAQKIVLEIRSTLTPAWGSLAGWQDGVLEGEGNRNIAGDPLLP
jgi:hypothetical protein